MNNYHEERKCIKRANVSKRVADFEAIYYISTRKSTAREAISNLLYKRPHRTHFYFFNASQSIVDLHDGTYNN